MKSNPIIYLSSLALIIYFAVSTNTMAQSTLKGSPKVKIEDIKLTHKNFNAYKVECKVLPVDLKKALGSLTAELEQKADGGTWVKGKDLEIQKSFLKESESYIVTGELMRFVNKGKYKITVKENGVPVGTSIVDLPPVDIEITINFRENPQDSRIVDILGTINNNSQLDFSNVTTSLHFFRKKTTDPDVENSWNSPSNPAGNPHPINIPPYKVTVLPEGWFHIRTWDSENAIDVRAQLLIGEKVFLEKKMQYKKIREVQVKTPVKVIK